MAQRVASDVEMYLQSQPVYELSHIVFGGSDRQPVALF